VKDIVSADHSLKWKWGWHMAEMGDEVLLDNWDQKKVIRSSWTTGTRNR